MIVVDVRDTSITPQVPTGSFYLKPGTRIDRTTSQDQVLATIRGIKRGF